MPEQPGQKPWSSVDGSQLTALIDKLVAVQLDLKPLCSPSGTPVPLQTGSPQAIIAAACDILQSAIEDLRDVIHGLEDSPV